MSRTRCKVECCNCYSSFISVFCSDLAISMLQVGYTGYDTVRYVEKEKLPFAHAPTDDRNLPDMHMGIYHDVVILDQAQKVVYVVHWVKVMEGQSVEEAKELGEAKLQRVVDTLQNPPFDRLPSACVELDTSKRGVHENQSNMGRQGFLAAVEKAKEHIFAGDAFQIVLSHRFTRKTFADPFEIYRYSVYAYFQLLHAELSHILLHLLSRAGLFAW